MNSTTTPAHVPTTTTPPAAAAHASTAAPAGPPTPPVSSIPAPPVPAPSPLPADAGPRAQLTALKCLVMGLVAVLFPLAGCAFYVMLEHPSIAQGAAAVVGIPTTIATLTALLARSRA